MVVVSITMSDLTTLVTAATAAGKLEAVRISAEPGAELKHNYPSPAR